MSDGLEFTRRRAVQAASATTAALALGLDPFAGTALASTSVPAYLRRSGYDGLVGSLFALDGVAVRLESIDDMPDPSYAGRDDAFSLTFAGAASDALTQETRTLRNADLGTFSLFVVPVERSTTSQQHYQAVIDRTVKLATAGDEAPEPLALTNSAAGAASQAPTTTTPDPAHSPPHPHRQPLVSFASVARRGGRLAADIRLATDRVFVSVRVTLMHRGHVYAHGFERLRGRRGARVALRRIRRARAGHYVLVVSAVDRDGKRTTVRRHVTLR